MTHRGGARNSIHGTRHEGRVFRWFADMGYEVHHLSPSEPGDLVVLSASGEAFFLEVKRVTSPPTYRISHNPLQHDRFRRYTNPWYCVTAYTGHSGKPTTRFYAAPTAPPLLTQTGPLAMTWEDWIALVLGPAPLRGSV